MRLGAYRRSDQPGRWSSFVFGENTIRTRPLRVHQRSVNIRPARAAEGSRVIAYWEDANGRRLVDPAWVASDRGYWMSHVLLDGDVENKARMLLSMLGRHAPSVWARAAQHRLAAAGRIGPYCNMLEATGDLRQLAKQAPGTRGAPALIDRAEEHYREALTRFERGDYEGSIERAHQLRTTLLEAYARVQRPRSDEFRGVWDHDGVGWYPGDWDRTCRELAAQGITAVFPNMLWGGLAHYPSKVLPPSKTFRLYGDQVAACVKAAHKYGLEVHVWKVCWPVGAGAPDAFVQSMAKQDRLAVTEDRATGTWLSPAHPANRDLNIRALKELVSTYDIDGVHLDYIRFPGRNSCFARSSRDAFRRWLGRPAEPWPAAVRDKGKLAAPFQAWRRELITEHVKTVRRELRALHPGVKLSAAVFSRYPQSADAVGQDWGRWLAEGEIDFACPMNYTDDIAAFSGMTRRQLGLPGAAGRVLPGIGVRGGTRQLAADEVIRQILSARSQGARGFMLFDLSPTLRDETLPALRLGLTREDP
jgi:hypothetical protein